MSDIALFENERASNYDNFVHTWIPNYQFFVDLLPKLLDETQDRDLLVAGCGTGNEIRAFKQKNPKWKITGVDPSPEMVCQAREKLKGYDQVTLFDGEVKDLPNQHKFAAATLLLVLHFIKDDGSKLELLKQIADRLHPEAPFVMLDISGSHKQITDNLSILRHMLSSGLEEEVVQDRMRRIEEDLEYVAEERVEELLMTAGFQKPVKFFQSAIYIGWMTKKG